MTIWQRWKQTALHNKALVFSGVIVAFGTLFYSGAAIVQVCMFNRSSKQAEQQTAELIKAATTQARAATKNANAAASFALSADGINSETRKAVDQFRSLANSTQAGLENTQKSFRLEQRPYLWAQPRGAAKQPDGTWGTIRAEDDGKSYRIAVAVDLLNSGRSPAVDVVNTNMEYKYGPSKTATQEAKAFIPATWGGPVQIVPGSGMTPTSAILTLTNEEVAHIADETWEVYVVGAVRYRDTFSPKIKPYETTYCFIIRPTGMAFGACNFGNSIK